jgi:uncharacterized protein
VAGLIMAFAFERGGEPETSRKVWNTPAASKETSYSPGRVSVFLGSQVGLLILLGLGGVPLPVKVIGSVAAIASVVYMAFLQFHVDDRKEWIRETWTFAKQIMPYLLIGVFLAGLVSAILPADVVGGLVGGNGVAANSIASVSGAFMYFATLTEIPILQSLIKLGMGSGPAMALLLTGNALSIPNLIVLNTILGFRKTLAYLALTVGMSIAAGMMFGALMG